MCTIENGMLLIKKRVKFQLKMNFSKTSCPVAVSFLCVSVFVSEFLFLCVFCGKQKKFLLILSIRNEVFEPVEKLPNMELKAGGRS